jgi:hypothetical protein
MQELRLPPEISPSPGVNDLVLQAHDKGRNCKITESVYAAMAQQVQAIEHLPDV